MWKDYAKFRQKLIGRRGQDSTLPKNTNSFIYAMHDRMLYQMRISENRIEENNAFLVAVINTFIFFPCIRYRHSVEIWKYFRLPDLTWINVISQNLPCFDEFNPKGLLKIGEIKIPNFWHDYMSICTEVLLNFQILTLCLCNTYLRSKEQTLIHVLLSLCKQLLVRFF